MKYRQITEVNTLDIAAMVDVANESYKEHYLHLWKDNGVQYMAQTISESVFKEWVYDNSSIFLKVKSKNEIAGYIKLNKNLDLNGNLSSKHIELEKIHLLQNYSGNGLGTFCMEEIERIATRENVKTIWLKVMAKSKAVQFYLKNGFEIIGKTELVHPMILSLHSEMYIMSKSL